MGNGMLDAPGFGLFIDALEEFRLASELSASKAD